MMKRYYFILSVIFAFLVVTNSCTKDPAEPAINESEVLVKYLESTDSPYGKDFVNTDLPSLITASDLNSANLLGTVYIIDVRSAADFNTGHIANAHNVAPADVFTHLAGVTNLASYEKIAVVCYTGQTAGFITSLLKLSGVKNAFSLKFGMASWHEDFSGKYTPNIGSAYSTQFKTTDYPKAAKGELPGLSTGKKTGEEIFEARLAAVMAEGWDAAKITNTTVYGNLSNYYIVNYWPANHYASPGHIEGAMQYTPKESLKLATDLTTLPTNKTIVVYCYSGQTSAFLAAYLRILGYDAKSLLFGTNGMIYNDMVANGTMSGSIYTAPVGGYDYVGMPPAK